MPKLVNPFTSPGKWYKANLHTHTTTSDGAISPRARVAQYRKAGYQVLALTDHRVTNSVRGLSDERMLVVSGIEYHPTARTRPVTRYHIVGLGVPHGFKLSRLDSGNRCIAEIAAAGGISILGHPYWSGQSLRDFIRLKGLSAIEVFNATCDGCGRGSSEHEWTHALDNGMFLPCVGVDDAHMADAGDADVCACWTWLKMTRLTQKNVLKAVRTGACYASRGPVIHDFRVADGRSVIRCSPVREIYFICAPSSGKHRVARPGESLEHYEAPVVPAEKYIRAVVIDAEGRQAWTNPLRLR